MSTTPVLPPDLHPRAPFWASAAPLVVTTDSQGLARRQVDGIVEVLGLQPGDAVLDLHCAANGQVAVELARRGMTVTAVAFNAALGALTRQRAAAAALPVRVVEAADDDWARDIGEVVAALDLGSPFGVADGLDDPTRPLALAVDHLAPGGQVAVLTMGTEVALRTYVGRDWYEHGDRFVLLEAEPVAEWTRMEHRWRIYEGGVHSDLQFSHRLLTARQARAQVRAAGATTCVVHGCDVDGRPGRGAYGPDSHRLLAVGTR